MLSDNLLSLLTSFTKVELNRFRKYLLSPYLNEQPDATRLFDFLNESIRQDMDVTQLTKAMVWETLYPARKFDDAHLRRLSSDLSHLAMRFMVAEARNNDPLNEALDLQKVLEKPLLKKLLASTERQIFRLFDETPGQSSELLLAQFRMHHRVFSRASKLVAITGYGDKLSTADFYLECFYLIQKLKYYVAWLQFSGIRDTEKVISFMPGFWEEINSERFKNIPFITVFSRVVLCFTEPNNESHFQQLLIDLDKQAGNLPKEDLRECYQIAQNYCALKVNQGQTDYYPIFFRVLKKTVLLEILVENNHLTEGVFKNMVTISMWVGEFAWAENFINEYAAYLPAPIRENAKRYSLANIYFRQKKHAEVIDLLQNVEYNDIVYALGSKLILLRTYYETNESLALESLMDSFRIYIRRNKLISKNQKREYNNFLNFVKKLTYLNTFDSNAISKFKNLVTESSSNMPKKWLLEKIDEIAASKRGKSANNGANQK